VFGLLLLVHIGVDLLWVSEIGQSLVLLVFLVLLTVARRCIARDVLVGTAASSSQMSIVDSWVKRYRRSGTNVLIAVMVYHLMELIGWNVCLIKDDVVVRRTSRTLDGRMRAQVEVILKRMSDISLNQNSRNGVLVSVSGSWITLSWEEANLVALAADDNSEQNLRKRLAFEKQQGIGQELTLVVG